jgi:hypothetical protein
MMLVEVYDIGTRQGSFSATGNANCQFPFAAG